MSYVEGKAYDIKKAKKFEYSEDKLVDFVELKRQKKFD